MDLRQIFQVPLAEVPGLYPPRILREVVAKALEARTVDDREAAARALDDRLALYGVAVDRILGGPGGTVRFGEPGFGAGLLAADQV